MEGVVAPPAGMTAAEAHAAAEAEGLTLLRAEIASGFKHVYCASESSHPMPFLASLTRGRHKLLRHFATAEEAALAVARLEFRFPPAIFRFLSNFG